MDMDRTAAALLLIVPVFIAVTSGTSSVSAAGDGGKITIHFLESSYTSDGTGVIRVFDPKMDATPNPDEFDVDVWSSADLAGIAIPVTETENMSGIFEGTVFFTTTDDSSGHRLRVAGDGDVFSHHGGVIGKTHIDGTVAFTSEVGVHLDKTSYAWDGQASVTIHAPQHNLDKNAIESLGPGNGLTVTSRGFEYQDYVLSETGPDTGIFAGKISIAENKSPSYNDGISVFFEYADDRVALNSAQITDVPATPSLPESDNPVVADRPDAYLEWANGDTTLLSTEIGVINVHDAYANQDPAQIETLNVIVYVEERHDESVVLELSETDADTGIFEGMVRFSGSAPSLGDLLHVLHNDVVSAEYSYSTDPASNILDVAVGDDIRVLVHDALPSLKHQISNGIGVGQITCPNTLHVLTERPDGNLACISEHAAGKLGWKTLT